MVAIPAVSLIAVLAATGAGYLIGAVWSAVPGVEEGLLKWWGLTEEVFEKIELKAAGLLAVWLLITAYILGVFIKLVLPSGATYLDGLELGFLAWLGFLVMVNLTNWFFENRPVNAQAANWLSVFLAIYLVMGAILAVWG